MKDDRNEEKKVPSPKVKSLHKALQILGLFSEERPTLSITEIARETGLQKSSVHNIMSTFELDGYVQRDRANRFGIGKKILGLSRAFSAVNPHEEELRRRMAALADKTGETVYAAVPYGIDVIYIDSIFSSAQRRLNDVRGVVAPMFCTAIGKAILAFSEQCVIDEALRGPFTRFTENTIVSARELEEELRRIRGRGYAIDNMEHEFGIKCVGVAVIEDGKPVGGISVSGPSPRFTEEKIALYAQYLQEEAKYIRF